MGARPVLIAAALLLLLLPAASAWPETVSGVWRLGNGSLWTPGEVATLVATSPGDWEVRAFSGAWKCAGGTAGYASPPPAAVKLDGNQGPCNLHPETLTATWRLTWGGAPGGTRILEGRFTPS